VPVFTVNIGTPFKLQAVPERAYPEGQVYDIFANMVFWPPAVHELLEELNV
jgi:hypothetical protein